MFRDLRERVSRPRLPLAWGLLASIAISAIILLPRYTNHPLVQQAGDALLWALAA